MRDCEPGLVVLGVNFRSAPLGLRDRLFVEDADVPAFLDRLGARAAEALVLSTCDRVEVWTAAADGAEIAATEAMAAHGAIDPRTLAGHTYLKTGPDALRHLFRVAASLDSQVVGEPYVLGQLKACHRLARAAGRTGAILESALQAAYGAAKRVRAETAIGEGPASIAAAALEIAGEIHGELKGRSVLAVGGGELGTMIVRALQAAGAAAVTTHPNPRRTQALAQALDCHAGPFDELARLIAEADIVVASLGERVRPLGADLVRGALRRRGRRPIYCIDAALPGDIDPAVNRLEDVFLYDLADLETVARDALLGRARAAERAEAMVAEAAQTYRQAQGERRASPVVTRLRARFEEARAQALAQAGGDVEAATRLLVNRLLHAPSAALKADAAQGGGQLDAAARALFGLDDDEDDAPTASETP